MQARYFITAKKTDIIEALSYYVVVEIAIKLCDQLKHKLIQNVFHLKE